MKELNEADRQAIAEAFAELEDAIRHLDAMEDCGPLFGRVKQEMEADGKLDGETREAFLDRIIDLYTRARAAREDIEATLPEAEDAQAAARKEADAYHRDTATLLNAVSMLCFIEPGTDRAALMERIEAAYTEQQD